MKKAGNIIASKFIGIIKSRHIKRNTAAAVAILLAAAVVTTSVFNRTQAAENEDTLMGIEKLRNQFSDGKTEYTVLEIVPDINAAEIGYIFDGYEPVLSKWDSKTMTWKSWKDILCGIENKEERKTFMETKKEQLQAYYDAQGIKDNVPVTISKVDYDDREEYEEGFEAVEAGSSDMTGYFTSATNRKGKYYVEFVYIDNYKDIQKQPDTVYYKLTQPELISSSNAIAAGAYIYKFSGGIYESIGTWGENEGSITLPSSDREEYPSNDDGNKGDNGDDDNNGVDDDNNGGDDNGNGGDDNGNGGDDNGNGDDDNRNGGDDNGNGGDDNENSGEDNGNGGEDNGNGDDNGNSNDNVGDNTGDSNGSVNSGTGGNGGTAVLGNKSAAVGKSFSQMKWIKFVNADESQPPASSSSEGSGEIGSDKGKDNGSGEGSGSGSGEGSGSGSGEGSGSSSEEGSGSSSGEGSGDDLGGGSEEGSGDDLGGGSEEGSGDDLGGGSEEGSGNNLGEGSGNNSGNGSGEGAGDNQGDDGEDDNKEDGDNSEQDPDDENNDPDKDSDEDTDKDADKNPDKKPDKDNIKTQDTNDQSEQYYLAYFDIITDDSYTGPAYVVNEKSIKPAKYGSYNNDGSEHLTGQYNFKEEEGDNTQTYTFPGRVLYCKGIFHNNEWFKHKVINMSSDNFSNFKVKVITLTPADLNNIYENGMGEYAQGTIPDFNFLYLNSGLRPFVTEDVTPPSDDDTPPSDGWNGDGGNTDEDNKPDDGEDNKPDNGENGGDTDEGNKPDDGEDNKPDNDGNGGETDESNKPDDSEDNKPDNDGNGGESDEDNKPDDDENGGDTSEDNKSDSDVTSGSSSEDNKPSGAVGSGDDVDTSASVSASVWRTYVSNDDSGEPSVPSATDKTSKTEKPKTADKSDDADSSGSTDSTNTDNTDIKDNADIKDDADTKDDADIKDDADTKDDADVKDDADTKDDADNKDNNDDLDAADEEGSKEGSDATDKSDESDAPSNSNGDNADKPKKASASSIVVYNTANNDLDRKVADLLFERIASKELPCLVDGSILYGKAESGVITDKSEESNTENTGIFRLAAMLCQENLKEDYTGVSKENLLKGLVDDADKNYTTDQVYCRLGNGNDSIINDNFFTYTIYKEGGEVEEGFQNVLDEIKLENLYRESDTSGKFRALPTNISQAEALRHILNCQNRRSAEPKKSIKVLEIQPALTTKPELTKEQLQKWAPGVEEVETTIMTTAEFIGKIDKINEIYDLVYIGTSKEHLNLKNWVTDTGKSQDGKYLGSTVFNDSDMDGLIYYNVGDKRVVYLPMSGLLDSEYHNGRTYYYNFTRYGGNDVTKEKKDALLSFLNGSYPVIVSDEFIEQPVTVFEDEDYAGRRGTLDVGEYKEQDLLDNQIYAASGTPAKGISSIQVKKGYQITLFENDDCTGNHKTFTESVKNLSSVQLDGGQTWNNRCRSIFVEKVEDAQPVREIDGNHIDNSSYLYEFVNTAMKKKYTNFYAKGDIEEDSQLFKFYLNRAKVNLVDFTVNAVKSETVNGNKQVNDVYYLYSNYLGRYTMQFDFAIQNEGAASMDTRYYCKLYIDVNADGKFSEFEEVSDIVMTNRNNGGIVSANELYAGNQYRITREVPTGYKGLLPWKVEICQINNENIYASEQGYTKLLGLDKEVLKICQITKVGDDVIKLDEEISTPGSYFNILIYGGEYNGVHYPGITNDFELDVTTINIAEYEENYRNNSNYLDDFNMLILGFSDMYGDFTGDSESGAMGAIVDFINSGKSVLMAHDTTSFFNNPIVDGTELGYTNRNGDPSSLKGYGSDWRFAATLNKYIRPLVGMDRYGVLSSSVVKRGVSLHEGDAGWNELMSSGREVAYKPKSGRKETVPEAQGYTYTTITSKDKRDDGNDANLDYTRTNLNLGKLDKFRNEYVSQRFDDSYFWDWGGDNVGHDNGEMERANNGEVWNVHVTRVNSGQITEYPYKLQEEFEVGLTHAQYYQLDYTADDDGDGQSDLVVWYCLGGRTSGIEERRTTVYSQSPNDVRNNYYIYNKGNITYTGMGHASRNDWNRSGWYTFDEAKLFINTMIASYQAGVKPPTITILESGLPEASQLTTMYRYYDETNMISLADEADNEEFEKVYFTVRDINFVKGDKVIASHAYYHIDGIGGSDTISVDGEEIPVIPLAENVFNASNDMPVDAQSLNSGDIYYLLVPKTVMSQCENGLDIYFEAQSTITTNTTKENVYTTDKVYAKLQVLRAYLFELD